MSLTNELRDQICRFCKDKRRRSSEFSRERPTRWQPTTIVNPEYGFPFTEPGAWQFIADLLESGHPFKEMELRKPKGATGYEAWKELADGKVIYIKIQPCGNRVYGRSFHYDQPPDKHSWN